MLAHILYIEHAANQVHTLVTLLHLFVLHVNLDHLRTTMGLKIAVFVLLDTSVSMATWPFVSPGVIQERDSQVAAFVMLERSRDNRVELNVGPVLVGIIVWKELLNH